MAGDKELLIRVRADIRQSLSEMRKMTKEIRATGKASAGSSKQVASMGKAMTFLTRGAAAYLSLRTATALVRQADAYNVLQVRIRTATKATGDYARVSRELFNISQQNGTALETTVSLFQSLARSAPELNATTDEILTLVNAVQQLGVISGASPGALRAGLLQFSQGLSAGVFRAEEFNSILENLPEVAVRIANGMNKTVGELRKGILEGRVLSREVFDSLQKQAPEIAQEFQEIPDSVGRASTALVNSFSQFLGKLDEATGLTETLAKLMREVSASLDRVADVSGLSSFDLAIERINRKASFLRNNLNKGLFSKEAATEAGDELIRLEKLLSKLIAQRAEFAKTEQDAPIKDKELPVAPITPEEQQRIKSNAKIVEQLQFQAATFGKTREQIALYKLELQGAGPAQLEAARAAIETTNAMRTLVEGLQAEIAAEQELRRAEDENREADENKIATLKEEIRLQQLSAREKAQQIALAELSADATDAERESVKRLAGDLFDLQEAGKDTFDALEAATRGWGNEFTNTLADMVLDGKANFKDLADSIIRDLIRIQIQQQITKPLLGKGTEILGDLFNFADGGRVVGPGTSTSDSIPARLSNGEYVINAKAVKTYGAPLLEALNRMQLPRFTNVPSIPITRPAINFASGGLAEGARQPGGNVKVEIVNNGQPARVADTQVTADPKDFVIRVMLEDQNSDGPVTTNLSQTFGLRRSPR